jgi:hypothetical protein
LVKRKTEGRPIWIIFFFISSQYDEGILRLLYDSLSCIVTGSGWLWDEALNWSLLFAKVCENT